MVLDFQMIERQVFEEPMKQALKETVLGVDAVERWVLES